MIETSCECGAALSAPESCIGQTFACQKCRAAVQLACAEMLSDGGGAGDFDAHLVIVSGPDRIGEQFLLGGIAEITIGKLPDRNINLQGKKISRGHCKLTRIDFGPSRWELHDNKSTNGLFVNDQRILSQELKDGNVVRVGEYELRFVSAFQRDVKVAKQAARSAAIAGGAAVCPSCGNVLASGVPAVYPSPKSRLVRTALMNHAGSFLDIRISFPS
jgi:FHA domain